MVIKMDAAKKKKGFLKPSTRELCVSVCPKHILALDSGTNAKGYRPVMCTDLDSCIGCASCARICPDSIITIKKG